MQRNHNLQRLQTEEFDLCIIGGGASGAGCALDAALRGLKVALVEKTDFAAETSGRSTKLVHGGVRYLEQAFKKLDFAQLKQVRHGLEERHIVLQNAPHLAHPLGLVTPVYSWLEGLYFYIGLCLYEWFARKDDLPSSRWLSKKEVLQMMPGISPDIHSAVLYYDGQFDDTRYCLALAQSAAEAGAVVVNYTEVIDFQKDATGKLSSVTLENKLDGAQFQLRARQFLNCCGPYSDHIRLLANPALSPRISPSKGVHLILPLRYFGSKHAMLIPKTKDGRVVFAIPFEGALLLGTTDDPGADLTQEPLLEAAEVDFLIETLQPFVAEKIDRSEVKAGFGGIRPLVTAKNRQTEATKSMLRDHEVEFDAASGLVSLLGGKWTTYRLMAKDTVDFICKRSGTEVKCRTESHLLNGAEGWKKDSWKKLGETYHLMEDVSQHLAAKYGTNAGYVADLTLEQADLAGRIVPGYPFIKAEAVYAAQAEMALNIRDFLARRIRLEFIDWQAAANAAPEVARLMGGVLNWTPEEQKAKAQEYLRLIEVFQQHRAGTA